MRIIKSFKELEELHSETVCALGTFDGVHRGHAEVIRRAVQKADSLSLPSVVITFDKHPFTVLRPKEVPTSLCLENDKMRFISDLGVDYTLILPMTKELLSVSAEDFTKLLITQGRIKAISIGENFTYGYMGKGNVDFLLTYFHDSDVEVLCSPLSRGGKEFTVISSSAVRKALREGKISDANAMLGRPYTFEATVVTGDARGRLLGFPTANFMFPPGITVPKDGVYFNHVEIEGHTYRGIGNIGDNPTFENQYHRLEIHILNFNEDIYGKKVRIEFLDFLRGQRKFDSVQALKDRLALDKRAALDFFG